LQQTLQNELYRRKIQKNVATVITQVLVDRTIRHSSIHPSRSAVHEQEEALRRQNEAGLDRGRRRRTRLAARWSHPAAEKSGGAGHVKTLI